MKSLLKFSAWMVLLIVVLTSCASNDPSINDNGGDDPNNPTPADSSNTNYKSDFTKRVFNSPEEIKAFIPVGIYEIDYLFKHFEAFGTDGSYTSNYLYDTPEATVYLNKGADAYNVLYESDRSCWVRQDAHNIPAEPGHENAGYLDMSDATQLLTMFITDNICEKAPTQVSDDKVAGVDVKHYLYETLDGIYVTDNEYWVTSTGLCLKYQLSGGTKANPTTLVTGSVTRLTSDVSDFKDILSKAPQLTNAPSAIPDFDGLYTMTYTKYANEWLYDQYSRTLDKWIIPYTGPGTINYMQVWHDPKQSVYDGWTNIYFSVTVPNHQDILDYVNSVMKVELMTQTAFVDQTISGESVFSFEANNSGVVVKSGDCYIAYSISNLNDTTYYVRIRLWVEIFV